MNMTVASHSLKPSQKTTPSEKPSVRVAWFNAHPTPTPFHLPSLNKMKDDCHSQLSQSHLRLETSCLQQYKQHNEKEFLTMLSTLFRQAFYSKPSEEDVNVIKNILSFYPRHPNVVRSAVEKIFQTEAFTRHRIEILDRLVVSCKNTEYIFKNVTSEQAITYLKDSNLTNDYKRLIFEIKYDETLNEQIVKLFSKLLQTMHRNLLCAIFVLDILTVLYTYSKTHLKHLIRKNSDLFINLCQIFFNSFIATNKSIQSRYFHVISYVLKYCLSFYFMQILEKGTLDAATINFKLKALTYHGINILNAQPASRVFLWLTTPFAPYSTQLGEKDKDRRSLLLKSFVLKNKPLEREAIVQGIDFALKVCHSLSKGYSLQNLNLACYLIKKYTPYLSNYIKKNIEKWCQELTFTPSKESFPEGLYFLNHVNFCLLNQTALCAHLPQIQKTQSDPAYEEQLNLSLLICDTDQHQGIRDFASAYQLVFKHTHKIAKLGLERYETWNFTYQGIGSYQLPTLGDGIAFLCYFNLSMLVNIAKPAWSQALLPFEQQLSHRSTIQTASQAVHSNPAKTFQLLQTVADPSNFILEGMPQNADNLRNLIYLTYRLIAFKK